MKLYPKDRRALLEAAMGLSLIHILRARALGEYNDSIFISGFFINALLAAAMTYFGKRINLQLELAAMVVFATRIFQNLSLIHIWHLAALLLGGRYLADYADV